MKKIYFPRKDVDYVKEELFVIIDTQIFLGATELDYVKFAISPQRIIKETKGNKLGLMKYYTVTFPEKLQLLYLNKFYLN